MNGSEKSFWAYASDESFDNDALIKEKYSGIRPAPGYPACPDHTEKAELFKLLEAEKNAGIALTEHFCDDTGSSRKRFLLFASLIEVLPGGQDYAGSGGRLCTT